MSTIDDFARARAQLRDLVAALPADGVEQRDGSYVIDGYGVELTARIRDIGGPVLAMAAIAARDVEETPEMLAELRDFTAEVPYGRVNLHDRVVAVVAEVGRLDGVDANMMDGAGIVLAASAQRLGRRVGGAQAIRLPVAITLP